VELTTLWGRLRDAANRPTEDRLHLWAWLKEKLDLAQYRPQAVEEVTASQLSGRAGEYYVIKNPAQRTYYRLSDRDYFLWQLMDGTRSVKDLVVAYFLEYGSFAFARVATLVLGLKASFFLKERPVNVYRSAREQLLQRRPWKWVDRLWKAFLQKEFAVSGLDGFVGGAYRWGGKLLFTWPAQVLFVVVSGVGLYLFFRISGAGTYSVMTMAGSYWLGVAALIIANLVSVFLHEMAHALTVKHYGREVRRGGFMLYFGTPAFFVDTTDIWMEAKRARLAVTWAGPYSGLILSGLACIAMTVWPDAVVNSVLFKFVFLTNITVLFNLNPLLELDGYYLLMDWLEIPMLRRKSLGFIRSGLWRKLRGLLRAANKERRVLLSFSREERLFTVFGLLSAAWTAYALYTAGVFWQERLAEGLRGLWVRGGSVTQRLLAAIAVLLSLPFVATTVLFLFRQLSRLVGWATRRGVFNNRWTVAALLLVAVVALSWAPSRLDYAWLPTVLALLSLVSSTVLGALSARNYRGSRLAAFFSWLAGLAVALLLMRVTLTAANWLALEPGVIRVAVVALGHIAHVSLLVAAALLFVGTNLKELHALEKALLGAGLLIVYGLVLWLCAGQPLAGLLPPEAALVAARCVAPVLALVLLVPTLVSFWRTDLAPAWLVVAAALVTLTVFTLLSVSPLSSYLLLAASLLLHYLAYRRMALPRKQPIAEVDLSDQRRLQRAFGWTAAAAVAQFRQIGGERAAQALAERFNNYALAAGWPVSLVKDDVRDAIPAVQSLIERGETYAAALTLLLDLMSKEIGEKLTVRALQRGYDGLPWEEREIGNQYLFRDVKRAESLSAEFKATRQEYRNLLRRMPLFATMDDQEISLLISRLQVETYAPGQVIIRQGQQGDKFYIVRRGHVEVTQRDQNGVIGVVNQLDRGDTFGEVALLRDAPRNATCRATLPTELLALSRSDFDQLVKGRIVLRDKLDRSVARAELLRRVPLFDELDGAQIQAVASQLQEEAFEAGDVIIREGDIGDKFYVIESGRLVVSTVQDGQEKIVAERGPGEYVGEIALLLQVPRTATVKAITAAQVLSLHRDDFERLVAAHLRISQGLERETSRRMMDLRRAVPAA
jgi:putative peptide zinc metalloprotease protein